MRHLSNALDKVTKKFFHLSEGPYVINRVNGVNALALSDTNDSTKEIGVSNRTNLIGNIIPRSETSYLTKAILVIKVYLLVVDFSI